MNGVTVQPATGEPESPERRRGSDLQGRQAEEHLSGGTAEESAWHRDLYIDSRKHRDEVHLEITPSEPTEKPQHVFITEDRQNHDRDGKAASERLRKLTNKLRTTATGVAGQLQQLATHVRDYLTGTGAQRQGMSELEQSGERLARTGRTLEQRSEPINTLVKQQERQLQQERRKMLPVVTIVLYFGTDRHWSSRKKIKELMEIPRCLDMYVNDYQMHVFEVAWLTEEQISRFHSDFKVVANFFVQKRKNRDYIPDDPTEIRHVDEVLKLLKVMTGDRRYEEIFRKKKGVRSMCDVAERLEKMGIAKGIEIGRSEGKMEGEIKGKMLVYKNLCREGFGEEEARRLTELPEDMSLEQ